MEGITRAYPLRILVQHEIVNDQLESRDIAVTYCPLCGSAMVFDRDIAGRRLTFGVSGLLYQSDVLMYDRQTQSLWSQLATKSVAGSLVNTELKWLASEQLTFAAWEEKYPTGQVLTLVTGFQRDYTKSPYAGYETSPKTAFPVPFRRPELPIKSWIIGVVVNGFPEAYPVSALPPAQSVVDTVNGLTVEVMYDPETRLATVKDVQSGIPLPSTVVYWFAWQAFYPQTGLWRP
jgi:hypothetical protein